ncbi:hypothetical protein BS50DRAFT_603955 [Corynespora cassiicola Philippines]|uniref:Phosphotransferase family protein n=1 Tax=Corynespora cassiicola Philippines TaxID=1448308 RepID=A0A2T2N8R4_CORCC|nr:hypothetical protein BS50DRAFT_603955 [Corynespora cassiicola Philippines]
MRNLKNLSSQSRGAARTPSTRPARDHGDFYHYTNGRWLWDEESQLRERYRRFNVAELERLAAKRSGAQACVAISKLAEGGFNKVFRLVMNTGAVVIARVPNPNAGPAPRRTNGIGSCDDGARTVLDIPVPRVLGWNGEARNPVEAEYILMEKAVRSQLGGVWEEMELRDKLEIVDEIVATEKKLLSVSFTRYGNLYFAKDVFQGCERAEVIGEVPPSDKKEVEDRFIIGPVVDLSFWHRERASVDIDHEPWKHPEDYLRAIGQREIAWIGRYATPILSNGLVVTSEAQSSPDAHIALYRKFLNVVDCILPKRDQARPTLHAMGQLVNYNGEMMMTLPDDYKSLEDEEQKVRICTQVEKPIILWTYKNKTKNMNPVIYDIFRVNHGRTRPDTVDISANTWNGDIIPFRQCSYTHWREINPDIPCPINFTDEDIKAHLRDGEGWNENADFWDSLQGFVGRDGYTSNEYHDQALEMFLQLREQGLQTLSGEEWEAFEKNTRWAVKKVE